jgi:putative endonuclease
MAARFLQTGGWRILKRNYRAQGGGEVDLVCRDGNMLVFSEVKTRTSDSHGRPMDAVNAEKEQLIIRGAISWLKLLDNNDVPYRFDIVEVILKDGERPHVNVVENAFQLPEVYRFN